MDLSLSHCEIHHIFFDFVCFVTGSKSGRPYKQKELLTRTAETPKYGHKNAEKKSRIKSQRHDAIPKRLFLWKYLHKTDKQWSNIE